MARVKAYKIEPSVPVSRLSVSEAFFRHAMDITNHVTASLVSCLGKSYGAARLMCEKEALSDLLPSPLHERSPRLETRHLVGWAWKCGQEDATRLVVRGRAPPSEPENLLITDANLLVRNPGCNSWRWVVGVHAPCLEIFGHGSNTPLMDAELYAKSGINDAIRKLASTLG